MCDKKIERERGWDESCICVVQMRDERKLISSISKNTNILLKTKNNLRSD